MKTKPGSAPRLRPPVPKTKPGLPLQLRPPVPKSKLGPPLQLPPPLPVEMIEKRIYLIRGLKVMIDSELAELYQSQTSRLNEAVKRNRDRFPQDFMFQLTEEEAGALISQFAISNTAGRGGRRTLPYAFTEHGVAMLSSVLNSPHAIQLNILIIRAFVRLRQILASHQDLARKIEDLDREQCAQGAKLDRLYDYVTRHLVEAPAKPKRRIGFAASAGQQ